MWQIDPNGCPAPQIWGTGEIVAAAVVAPGPYVLDQWDQLVRLVPGSDVAQLSGWARVRAEAGYEPIYVLARHGDTLVGGAQILRRPVPLIGGVGYLPYGPVVAPGQLGSEVADVVCEVLRNLPTLGLGALFVQPCLGDTAVGSRLRRMGFRASEAGIAPSASIRVDLSPSEDELRAGLSRRLRTWTRQWDQRGVRVRLGDAADVPVLTELAASTAAHQGFTSFDAGYLETLYRSLRAGDGVAILIAELHGTPVAAELLTICGGVIKSRVTGLDRARAEVPRLNVAAAMIWSAIRYGKSRGLQWYDFGGLRPELAEQMLSGEPVERAALPGPDQFKLGFGGVPCLYPLPVERIHSPLARRLYVFGTRTSIGQVALDHSRRLLRGGTTDGAPGRSRVAAYPPTPSGRDTSVRIVYRDTLTPAAATDWDRLVAAHPGSDVTQLVGWSRLRRAAGYRSGYLLAYRLGELVGGAQLLRRQLPVAGTVGYLPYGPMIFTSAEPAEVRTELNRALRDLPRLGLRALFVQPPWNYGHTTDELLDLGFRRSAAGIAPGGSVHVDLSPTEEELRAALGRQLRRWTRRWPDRGVRVRIGAAQDLSLLADLHAQTATHQDFAPLSSEYLELLYRELAPDGHAQIFIGEIDEGPVAGLLTTTCGGVLKTRVSGFCRGPGTSEPRVPAAVRWTAMLWAKEHGCRWFDLGGLSAPATRSLLAGGSVEPASLTGPDRFKLSFGGTAYAYPPAVELMSPALRQVYDRAIRLPGGQHLKGVVQRILRGGRNRG